MRFLEKIFSIKNKDIHKVVTFLGLKFKFVNSKKIIDIIISQNQRLNNLKEHVFFYESDIVDNGKNNKIILIDENNVETETRDAIQGLKIIFHGDNNTIKIYKNTNFWNCLINCSKNNLVEIKRSKYCIGNLSISPFGPMSDGSYVKIGENFSCAECKILLQDEPNQKIIIGNDNMFSFDIKIWPSDGHSILNCDNNVCNYNSKGIKTGDHVWLGCGTTIMKNVFIEDNTIIGLNSVVNKSFNNKNVIIAGVPAKIVKENINWARENIYYYENN